MDMAIKPSGLQIDICVTNVSDKNTFKPPSRANSATELAPPNPPFIVDQTNHLNPSQTSLMSDDPENQVKDIVDMYGGLDHEEHALDLTNFDKEDDTRLPGEGQLSQRLRKEGRIRRAETRRQASLSKFEPPQTDTLSPGLLSSHGYLSPSYEPLKSVSPISPISPPDMYPPPTSTTLNSLPRSSSPVLPISSLESKFDLDEIEARDMLTVAERARPGRPRIDVIIAGEARRCQGSMIVACEYYFRSYGFGFTKQSQAAGQRRLMLLYANIYHSRSILLVFFTKEHLILTWFPKTSNGDLSPCSRPFHSFAQFFNNFY